MVLVVKDNGVGFDGDAGEGASTGLQGMRERVESLHGTLEINTGRAGVGTCLTVMIPAEV